jgi:hypothetical protein
MTSPTKAFFDDLAKRGHVPSLAQEHGRVRFEVVDTECVQEWTLGIDGGNLEVSRGESDVDVVVRVDREVFERAVHGEENLLAAALRGEISYTGSLELLGPVGSLLPGPPDQMGPRKVAKAGRRRP